LFSEVEGKSAAMPYGAGDWLKIKNFGYVILSPWTGVRGNAPLNRKVATGSSGR